MQGWEYMPSFDHGIGDPVEKDIYVAPQYVYHLPPFAVEEKTFNPVHVFLTGLQVAVTCCDLHCASLFRCS
jgi:hypothetical protein